jgi:DNA-binding transcriptional MerR regulator
MHQSQIGFLTREDTLGILGVSPSTLQRWANNKLLSKYRVRGRVYYKLEELKQLIENSLEI